MSSPAVPAEGSPELTVARRYVPWLVAVALFMENLDATIVNTAVPTIAASLGVAPLSLKAVLTSYTLSLAVFIPISGWAADRYGTCKVFRWAVQLFLVGSLLCGIAPNVPFLVAARILQGIGGAILMALPLSIARDTVAKDRLGTAMGLFGTMSARLSAMIPTGREIRAANIP